MLHQLSTWQFCGFQRVRRTLGCYHFASKLTRISRQQDSTLAQKRSSNINLQHSPPKPLPLAALFPRLFLSNLSVPKISSGLQILRSDRKFNLTSGGSFLLAKARRSQPRAICSLSFSPLSGS